MPLTNLQSMIKAKKTQPDKALTLIIYPKTYTRVSNRLPTTARLKAYPGSHWKLRKRTKKLAYRLWGNARSVLDEPAFIAGSTPMLTKVWHS